MTQKYLVVTGNPVDGFSFYGTFEDAEEANDWADGNISEDWWVVEMISI